jgi:hypothetical protein
VKNEKTPADELFEPEYGRQKFRERSVASKEEFDMVHPGMVGITELMTDDRFMGWMERQDDDLLETLSTFEIYRRYCLEENPAIN